MHDGRGRSRCTPVRHRSPKAAQLVQSPGYIAELSSGNPATGMGDTGLWVISNSLPAAARITSITVSNGLPWIGSGSGGAPACVLGLQSKLPRGSVP